MQYIHWPEEKLGLAEIDTLLISSFQTFFPSPLQPILSGPASKHCFWFTWACIQALFLIYLGLHPSTVFDLPGPASKHCSWFTWTCIQALFLIYLGLHPSTVLDLPVPVSKHCSLFTWACIQALFFIYLGLHPSTVLDLPGPASNQCSWFTLGLHPSIVLDLPVPVSKHCSLFTWACIQELFLICCKEYRLLGSTTRIRRTSVSHSKQIAWWKQIDKWKMITKIILKFKIMKNLYLLGRSAGIQWSHFSLYYNKVLRFVTVTY